MKTIFINTFKITLTGFLIFWLITSGKLDFKLFYELQNHPLPVTLAIIFSLTNLVLISYRWKTILRARSQVSLPISGLIRINWIGNFFSSVLPGSVTGDLVKMIYVQRFDATFSKKFVFASILIDRVMGLSGLILLVGMSSLIFGGKIIENAPSMEPLLQLNYLIMGLVLFAFGAFFFFHSFIRYFILKLQTILPGEIVQKVISLWDELVLIRSKMLKAIGLSVVVQLFGVLNFWFLIHPFVEGQMTFIQALAFIPIGLMALALPIAPSGLGVGHAIFQKLFEMSGIVQGASLFNLYFMLTLVVNLFGAIPYLVTKTKEK
jgi:hypothetical protein